MALNWLGDEVTARLAAAQIAGVNATMAAAAIAARRNHAWNNRSGVLEGSIGVVAPAATDGRGVRGTWGSRDVRYALIHELGGVIRPVRARALMFRADDGTFVVARQVRMPARPYLRPAADAEYPRLAGRIRRAFARRSERRR